MDCFTILAQAVESTGPEVVEEGFVPINSIWEQITSLGLLEALTFISFGAVCLFYGWRIFKVLVVINFGLLGLVLGITITDKIVGLNNQLVGGVVGLILLAVLSVPLMRWSVCILGAMAGAILASGIWYAVGLNERYILAGSLVGIVAGGMISFIVFKIAVILFSSLWGSILVVIGSLALLYIYPRTTERVQELVFNYKWFLPLVLTLPTAAGFFLQNKFVKGSKDWDL